MGTKLRPGRFDCYNKALPDEPTFTLLARDVTFAPLVRLWAKWRRDAIDCGQCPTADLDMAIEAELCASAGAEWRRKNNGAWRLPQPRTHVAPPFVTDKGVQFFAVDSDGNWNYVNHAGEWQGCPPPFPRSTE